MNKIWKDIEGYEGKYKVSNLGEIKSYNFRNTKNQRLLKQFIGKDGYMMISLHKNGKGRFYSVHRLVAKAFIPNPLNKPQINHINEIRTDNRASNLEWCTVCENINYGSRTEKYINSRSKRINQFTLYGEFVKQWFSSKKIEEELGFNRSCISRCCRGVSKSSYGFVWKYT